MAHAAPLAGGDQPDSPGFYDRHWERTDTSADRHIVDKGNLVLRMAPADVRTVVDVGCGDGYLTHRLASRFEVLAVDRSEVALSRVRVPTRQASAEALPLADRAFDMAFSSEMLEHLPDAIFHPAARELSRVAARWLMVSVPDRENLRRRFARCPSCRLEFHIDGHHRAFDAAALDALFPDFERVATETIGPPEPATYAAVERVRQRLGRRWWVWKGEALACPGCGGREVKTLPRGARHRAVDRALDAATNLANRIAGRAARPYWLVALYRRREGAAAP